jgi:hypothetical protein
MIRLHSDKLADIPLKTKIDKDSQLILGGGKSKILILVQINKEDVISTQENELLMKIMGALKLNIDDIRIANVSQWEHNNFSDYKNALDFDKCVIFGVNPDQLFGKVRIANNFVFKYMDAEILWFNALTEMLDPAKVSLKKELWGLVEKWLK